MPITLTKTFRASADSHAKHNGQVTILRALTRDEADIDDVGKMYECRDQQGLTFHAFEDELEG